MIVLLIWTSLLFAEVHAPKHLPWGVPTGTPDTNDLIVRDIYALSSNDHTKFSDWVAYRLDASMDDFQGQRPRNWAVDPSLDPSETLEKDDYTGANAALSTHRGHQAPLKTFSGTADWRQVNFLSNITPQKSRLNSGVWSTLEGKVPALSDDGLG